MTTDMTTELYEKMYHQLNTHPKEIHLPESAAI